MRVPSLVTILLSNFTILFKVVRWGACFHRGCLEKWVRRWITSVALVLGELYDVLSEVEGWVSARFFEI